MPDFPWFMPETPALTVLIVGSGGREHAIAEACAKSPRARRVIAAPGNPGIAAKSDCFPVAADDIEGLVSLAKEQEVDFVIVGPEVPLALGLVDKLAEEGVRAYGPTADGARLEASKRYAKELLLKNQIPTGLAASFSEVEAALDYLQTASFPIVVKADGLAAGKGVVIAEDHETASRTIRSMIEGGDFGASGREVLVEECLFGAETSIHVIVSGQDYLILPTSQDHKQIFEGDKGPNTGGMGAYSPADLVDESLMSRIESEIVKPSVEAIAKEGIDFRGTLFIGIMITKEGPKVLEYNTRFGDPETQVILPRLATDPLSLLIAAQEGELGSIKLETSGNYSIVVVLASEGYPGSYPKGEVITLPEANGKDEMVYHAGTAFDADGKVVTSGGRVLGIAATDSTLSAASQKAYALCDKVAFRSKFLRRDIGAKELNRVL